MICRLVISVAATLFGATASSFAADALTSNIPPFSIEQGGRVGFVWEIVSEIAKRSGTEINVIYGSNWPQSQEEAKSRPDTLVFPLARTAARESQYQWVQKILDMDVAFATAPGRPKVETDAAARPLKASAYATAHPWSRTSRTAATPTSSSSSRRPRTRALHDGTIDAWYAPVPEVAFNWVELKLAAAPAFGLKLNSTTPLFIAASKNTPGIDLEKLRAAYASMERDGMLARILGTYGL